MREMIKSRGKGMWTRSKENREEERYRGRTETQLVEGKEL